MVEQLIVSVERLRDDLGRLKSDIRSRYKSKTSQVVARSIKDLAASLAETWLTEVAPRPEVDSALDSDHMADLTVHFQRLLTSAEHATTRARYDEDINAILKDYSVRVVVPLKALRGKEAQVPTSSARRREVDELGAFVGHSFSSSDEEVVSFVLDILGAVGIRTVTGSKPRAGRISEKVKKLIEEQPLFVGVFTCRDKIARKPQWTTTEWVIDEKAYAFAKDKVLILLKEDGVGSIGGIQGDYEYIPFSRDQLHKVGPKLLQLFEFSQPSLR